MRKFLKNSTIVGMVAVYAAIAFVIAYFIHRGGNYPTGSGVYDYIYRARILLLNAKSGNIFPIYDSNWFNGQELLRYVEPLPVYVLAIAIAICGTLRGYLAYVAFAFFASAIAWLYIGRKSDRLFCGFLMGILWFFTPNNMHSLFTLGNLSEVLSMVFLPLLIFNIYRWLFKREQQISVILGVILCAFFVTTCSFRIAVMTAISVLILGVVHIISYKRPGEVLMVILATVCGIALFGFWIYPALKGDNSATYSTETMKLYFQSFFVSLNPLYRVNGNDSHYYFGLAALLVALFGIIAAKKESRVGYIAAIILFISTTTSAYPILSKINGNKYYWMLQYISIAICLILLSTLYWESLKKIFFFICIFILFLDIVPSVMVNSEKSYYEAEEQTSILSSATLLGEARDITAQRMIFIDGDLLGAKSAYIATLGLDDKNPVAQSGGSGLNYAATSSNIVDLNEALRGRQYTYLFDRTLTLGCDTVLIYTDASEYLSKDTEELVQGASDSGYKLIKSKGKFYLFHIDTPNSWGVVSKFDAMGIGKNASILSYAYVDMEEGVSDNLSDYTFDDLSGYKLIYLSGFTYDNKKKAQNLIKKLSESGVKIVIDANNMPTDEHTGITEFLGVSTQAISFENGYPILYYHDEEIICSLFPSDDKKWTTAYCNGLDDVSGYLYDNNMKLAFCGNKLNDNITFIGISLPYHYYATYDAEGSKVILDDIIGEDYCSAPTRTVVPIDVSYGKNTITIDSDYDHTNTTIAKLDCMKDSMDYDSSNDLVYVDAGQTVIRMKRSGFVYGLIFSLIALAASVLICIGANYGQKLSLKK